MTKIKRRQPIASEGVLPYFEDGKIVWKLKTWDNLKTLIGGVINITDGHPEDKKINTATAVYGECKVIDTGETQHTLYADMYLDDNAPDREGYSMGYPYTEEDVSGEWEGQHYDVIQTLQPLDHMALTDYPRNDVAMASDEKDIVKMGKCYKIEVDDGKEVFKYTYALDTIRSFNDNKVINEKIKKKKLGKQKMPTIEQLSIENDTLKQEIATMKAIIKVEGDSKKAITVKDKEIDSLNKKLKKATDAIDDYKAKEVKRQLDEMDAAVAKLIKSGIDEKVLKGKSYDFVQGILSTLPNHDVDAQNGEIEEVSHENDAMPSTADYHHDGKAWVKN